MDYPSTARSRHGSIVKYAGVPIDWMSKLQSQFALSTAESEYIGLSTAARYIRGTTYLCGGDQQESCSYNDDPYHVLYTV